MPFIKQGSHVDLIAGPFAGRFGIVRDLMVCDTSGEPMLGVDVYHGERGRFVYGLAFKDQFKRRQLKPITREMLELALCGQEIEEAERLAA